MNGELELKLQAYLDGELSAREASRVEDWLEGNELAQALKAELSMTKGLMAGAELERALPESGDFYWSKIRREIDRMERAEAADEEPRWALLMRRFLAPAAGVAMVLLLAFAGVRFFVPVDNGESYLAEVETPSEEIGAYSFRSEKENMFVVWVYDRTALPEAELEPESLDDM